jgi:hypothetical protein
MIPRSYPSIINELTGESDMKVHFLSSVSGLQEWIDYIPVKSISSGTPNQYSNDGYKTINSVASVVGLQVYVDYIPVYVDASKTVPWSCDSNGFIPLESLSTTDPNFSDVTLLLHMDGADGSTSFPDSGPGAVSMTTNGGAVVTTAQSQFGGASASFPNSTSFLSVPTFAGAQFPGDFTIECWARFTAGVGSNMTFLSLDDFNGSFNGRWRLMLTTSNTLMFVINDNVRGQTGSVSGLFNTWCHVAVTRQSGNIQIFVNGDLSATASDSASLDRNITFRAGAGAFGGWSAMFMDDLRLTKGVARYTANFTPPTAPFPDA